MNQTIVSEDMNLILLFVIVGEHLFWSLFEYIFCIIYVIIPRIGRKVWKVCQSFEFELILEFDRSIRSVAITYATINETSWSISLQ